jgi:Immunity protein Imm1
MVVEFIDRQDKTNSLNGVKISTGAELSKIIDDLRNRPPFFCELFGMNDCKLLIGLGQNVCCIQYSPSDGSPPYLMATSNSETYDHDYFEFLIGGTQTPVPSRYCIPFDVMKRIAVRFVEMGLRDPNVCWEPVMPQRS